jgi:hypothetical protein
MAHQQQAERQHAPWRRIAQEQALRDGFERIGVDFDAHHRVAVGVRRKEPVRAAVCEVTPAKTTLPENSARRDRRAAPFSETRGMACMEGGA